MERENFAGVVVAKKVVGQMLPIRYPDTVLIKNVFAIRQKKPIDCKSLEHAFQRA